MYKEKETCLICNPTLESYKDNLIICKEHQSSINNKILILIETVDTDITADMSSVELHQQRTGISYYLHYSDWYMVTTNPIPPLGVAFVPATMLNSFYQQKTKIDMALHQLKHGAVIH